MSDESDWEYVLSIYDLISGVYRNTISVNEEYSSVWLTRDGRLAVNESDSEMLWVWDLQTDECLHQLKGAGGVLALTPDGRFVVSGVTVKVMKIWHLETGKIFSSIEADAEITAVACSADGQLIYAGDAHGRVHVLRLESGG